MSKIYYTDSPCKDCEDRTVGCHSICERYNNWKADSTEKPKPVAHSRPRRHRRHRKYRKHCIEVD